MKKKTVDVDALIEKFSNLALRQTVAIEKISNCLAGIQEALLRALDSNDGSFRIKDVERAKVYSTHLGKKLRK